MRTFIKNNIKPLLQRVKVYSYLYRFYFILLKAYIDIKNIFLSKITKTAPILLYHRVVDIDNDPVQLCISLECFEKHIIFIKKNTILSLL